MYIKIQIKRVIDSFVYKFYERQNTFVDFVGMLGMLSFEVGNKTIIVVIGIYKRRNR